MNKTKKTYDEGTLASASVMERGTQKVESTCPAMCTRPPKLSRGPGGCIRDLKRNLRQLLVLMWKHCAVRKRRFIVTPIELISPCLFFILIVLLKILILDKDSDIDSSASGKKTLLRSNEVPITHILPPSLALYTPATVLTGKLMDKAALKMDLDRLWIFPDSTSLGYYGVPESSLLDINDFVDKMPDDAAIVAFQGLNGENWPEKLDYTIRMKKKMITSDDENDRDEQQKGALNEQLLRLQWAIDSSFLSFHSKDQGATRSTQELPVVTLSEIPLTDKRTKLRIGMICSIFRKLGPFALLLPFVFLLIRLISERSTGVQELVRQVGVSYSVWACSHSCNMILTGLFYAVCGTAVCKITSTPLFPKTNMILLFLLFTLHFHSIMSIAFVCSYLSKSGDYASSIAVVVYVLICVPVNLLSKPKMSNYLRLLTGFIPHVPFDWFWVEVETLETKGKGLGFKDVMKPHTKKSLSVYMAYLLMIMQWLVFMAVASYFHNVCPSKYGTRKSWNYSFKSKDYVASAALQETREEVVKRDRRYFEDSQQTDIGIDIQNVTKIYGHKVVLSNVSFPVYQGEITVLLGHNGAGKTTLMSIITGMLSLTSGRVFVNGLDISHEKTNVQRVIGLCPQHNLFFPDLTILEHVKFFAMLKGESMSAADKSSKILLKRLGLHDKLHFKADQLSGGMKRRLQLACALAGGSNVLILDEPTSGLDVETRRELWNLLLSLRGERTVLLSTHFMEEADALGDKVAALHSGRLQCHASPMYLKKNIGEGYRLSLTTNGLPQVSNISAVITSVIPGATVKESGYNNVTYNLPSHDSDKFAELFSKLESRRSRLEILSIGVGTSSLEEVFLKLCSDVETEFTEEAVDTGSPEPKYSKITGLILYLRQLCVLIRRNLKYIMFRKFSFLLLEVFLPVVCLVFWAWSFSKKQKGQESKPSSLSALNLDIYNDKPEKTVLLRVNSADELIAVKRLAKHYENVEFQLTRDIEETLFRASKIDHSKGIDSSELEKYVVAVEVNNTNAKVLYSTAVRQAAPVALNLLSNILAAQHFPRADGKTIITNYQPLDSELVPFNNPAMLKEPKDIVIAGIWMALVVTIVMNTVINSVSLPVLEREAGTRHIHMMSGCPPAVHWLSKLVTHTFLYTFVLLVPATLVSLLDQQHTFNNMKFMIPLFVILLVGLIAFLLVCYLVTFSFAKGGSGLILTFLIIICGIVPGLMLFGTGIANVKLDLPEKIFCNVFYYAFPVATVTAATLKAAQVARFNALCNLNVEKCRLLLVLIFQYTPVAALYKGFDAEKCCLHEKGKMCTLCLAEHAPGKEIIIMVIQILVYGTLVILAQYGVFNGLKDRIFNSGYKAPPHRFHDKFVEKEEAFVKQKIEEPLSSLEHGVHECNAMFVHNLHKNYFQFLSKSCNAVKGISFSVKKGECFGLLGVNGAGKSTTFKMIAAEEVPTRGRIYANGYFLKYPRSSKYLCSLGYCPQFFGLDEFMTGHDNLATLMTLQGLHANDIVKETRSWIEVVGLQKYRDVLVFGYSGGCMRRLATAAALSSGAAVTLLDEPTAGVDVSARRRVWLAMRKGLRANRAIIITSHSMDEMEALCNRIAIMSGGEIGALGTAPALRTNYAAGHALSIKLKPTVAAARPEEVERLKEAVNEKFNCTLKDDHVTMLHYHINESMPYSQMFTSLKHLKKSFPNLVEDYSVTETTLEEVFLSFAKPKTDEEQGDGKKKGKKKNKKK